MVADYLPVSLNRPPPSPLQKTKRWGNFAREATGGAMRTVRRIYNAPPRSHAMDFAAGGVERGAWCRRAGGGDCTAPRFRLLPLVPLVPLVSYISPTHTFSKTFSKNISVGVIIEKEAEQAEHLGIKRLRSGTEAEQFRNISGTEAERSLLPLYEAPAHRTGAAYLETGGTQTTPNTKPFDPVPMLLFDPQVFQDVFSTHRTPRHHIGINL